MTLRIEPPAISLDADVLIYAALPRHPLGSRIRRLFGASGFVRLYGSMLLFPEVLTKPTAAGAHSELTELEDLLSQLELWPATLSVCEMSVELGAAYGLKTIDAVHLATAVQAGADAFLTNNTRDFVPGSILELDVLTPEDLPA